VGQGSYPELSKKSGGNFNKIFKINSRYCIMMGKMAENKKACRIMAAYVYFQSL
jgi:hypothetical protein